MYHGQEAWEAHNARVMSEMTRREKEFCSMCGEELLPSQCRVYSALTKLHAECWTAMKEGKVLGRGPRMVKRYWRLRRERKAKAKAALAQAEGGAK